MATRASIEFDFNQAINQAKRLEEVAANLNTLSNNDLQNALQGVAANWKGENATKYTSKGQTLQTKIKGSAGDLYAVARDIRAIAQRVYTAEMAALEIAEARAY